MQFYYNLAVLKLQAKSPQLLSFYMDEQKARCSLHRALWIIWRKICRENCIMFQMCDTSRESVSPDGDLLSLCGESRQRRIQGGKPFAKGFSPLKIPLFGRPKGACGPLWKPRGSAAPYIYLRRSASEAGARTAMRKRLKISAFFAPHSQGDARGAASSRPPLPHLFSILFRASGKVWPSETNKPGRAARRVVAPYSGKWCPRRE